MSMFHSEIPAISLFLNEVTANNRSFSPHYINLKYSGYLVLKMNVKKERMCTGMFFLKPYLFGKNFLLKTALIAE